MRHHKNQNNSGFALLIALLVVTVVITIGLAVLDLTLKQLRLSTNSKDSEIAFHAANAGLECALYHRNLAADDIEKGQDFNMECFGGGEVFVEATRASPTSGDAFYYNYTGSSADRCSEMTILAIQSSFTSPAEVSYDQMVSIIPGYPKVDENNGNGAKICPPAGICTVIASRGYNKPCGSKDTPGTIEREVLLEL